MAQGSSEGVSILPTFEIVAFLHPEEQEFALLAGYPEDGPQRLKTYSRSVWSGLAVCGHVPGLLEPYCARRFIGVTLDFETDAELQHPIILAWLEHDFSDGATRVEVVMKLPPATAAQVTMQLRTLPPNSSERRRIDFASLAGVPLEELQLATPPGPLARADTREFRLYGYQRLVDAPQQDGDVITFDLNVLSISWDSDAAEQGGMWGGGDAHARFQRAAG